MGQATLETLPNKNHSRRFLCHHSFPELTALCPVTKLPDFYTLRISYEPDAKLIELKSLKLYLLGFRDSEILHEEITNQIFDDFLREAEPRWARIVTKVNVRGGLYTTVIREWRKDEGDIVPDSSLTKVNHNR